MFTTIGAVIAIITLSLFIIGCPEDGAGGPSDPGGPSGTPPDPITNLNIAPQAHGVVLVTWEDPTDSNFSHVLITWTPNPPDAPVRIEKGIQTARITGLADAVEYTFSVRSANATGNTAGDAAESITISNVIPLPVANFAAVPAENGSAEITWTDPPIPDLSHIILSWTPMDGAPAQPLIIAKDTQTAVVTGLTEGDIYMFSAVSVDEAGGMSVETAPVSVTADATAPSPVTLTAAAGSNGRVEVTWTDPTEGDFSHILLSWTPGHGDQSPQPFRVDKDAEAITITGLTNAQTYTFTAVSVDAAGNRSAASTGVTATADTSIIGPVILTARAAANGSAVITWDDPPGATFSYIELSWSGTATQTSPLRVNAGEETTTITGLTDGTDYSFTAVSVTTSGSRSAASDAATITADSTPPTLPVNLSVTAGINGSAVISWMAGGGDGTQTTISWNPAHGDQTSPLRLDGEALFTNQTTTITGLTHGTMYTITITRSDAAGNITSPRIRNITADAVAPAEVTNVMSTTTASTATVTWTEPTVSDFSHVLITWTPNDGTTPAQPLRVNKGTETATLMNLVSTTDYTVTIKSVDAVGNTSTGATTTVTTIAPATTEATSPTATVITADGSTTLTWTDPTDTTNAAMIVITGSPAPTTEVAVAIGAQTAVISGLTSPGTDHVFTISTQDSSGTTASSGVDVTATSAVNRPVALFRLDGSATHDGDFGYGACQIDLDDTDDDSSTNPNDAITTALRNAGYTEAVFFGTQTTSGSEYGFLNLATDDDALGLSGTATDAQLEAREVVVYATASPIETFGSPTAVARTIGNVVNVTDPQGVWQNGGYDVVGSLVSEDFWSFTNLIGTGIDLNRSCSGATTSVSGSPAIIGTSASITGDARYANLGVANCSTTQAVICAAH